MSMVLKAIIVLALIMSLRFGNNMCEVYGNRINVQDDMMICIRRVRLYKGTIK